MTLSKKRQKRLFFWNGYFAPDYQLKRATFRIFGEPGASGGQNCRESPLTYQ